MSLIDVQHPIGYNLHPEVFRPSPAPVHFELPAKPTIKNDKIVKAQAFANILNSIGQLPDVMAEQWQKGTNLGLQNSLRQRYMNALASNNPGALAGFAVGPNGLTYNPSQNLQYQAGLPLKNAQVLEAQANAQRAQAEAAMTGAKADSIRNFGHNFPMNDANGIQESQGVMQVPVPADQSQPQQGGAPVQASVFGLVPDGNGGLSPNDPNDVADAGVKGFDPKHGAWGANIKDPNLRAVAVSVPDLQAAGVNLKNPSVDSNGLLTSHVAQVTFPDGSTRQLPIADKLGKSGRIDLTGAAYQDAGGPQNKNGGVINGVKFSIIPNPQANATPDDGSQPVADNTDDSDPTQADPTQVAQPDPSQAPQVAQTDDTPDPTQVAQNSQPDPQSDPSQTQPDDSQPDQSQGAFANFQSVDPGTAQQIGSAATAVGNALASLNTDAENGNPNAQDALNNATASISGGGNPLPQTFTNQAANTQPEFYINNQPVQPGVAVSSPVNDALGVSGGDQGGDPANLPQGATLTQDAFGPGGQLANFGASQPQIQNTQALAPASTPGTAMPTQALQAPDFSSAPTAPTQATTPRPTQVNPPPTAQAPATHATHAATGQVKNGPYSNGNGTVSVYQNGILSKTLMMGPGGNMITIEPPKRAVGFPTAAAALDDVTNQGLSPTGKVTRNPDGSWQAEGTMMPKLDGPTQKMIAEGRANGWPGTTEGKTQDQIQAELSAFNKDAGLLTADKMRLMDPLVPSYNAMPIVRNAPQAVDAYNQAKSAYSQIQANPKAPGVGIADKALIQESEKFLNPGVGVTGEMMKTFGATPGLIEKFSPDYLIAHATGGAILTPPERDFLMSAVNRAMNQKVSEMDGVSTRYIKTSGHAGIKPEYAGDMFSNPYKDAMGAPTSSQSTVTPQDQKALNWYNSPASKSAPQRGARGAIEASLRAKGLVQ